jgi:hypothetical protein
MASLVLSLEPLLLGLDDDAHHCSIPLDGTSNYVYVWRTILAQILVDLDQKHVKPNLLELMYIITMALLLQ